MQKDCIGSKNLHNEVIMAYLTFPTPRSNGSPPEDVCRHITHPFKYLRWKGYLWIDLNEFIAVLQKAAVVLVT